LNRVVSTYDGFAPIYDRWAAGMTEDVDFYVSLARAADGPVVEPGALVTCPFRSLLHLPTWNDRRRVFERVAASLRPSGRFAWNAFVFDPAVAAEVGGVWREEHGIRHRIEYVTGDCRIDIQVEAGPSISLWWVNPSEWTGLVDVSGLEVEARYGWFDRRPFDETSRELVCVARKPPRSSVDGT